VDPRSADKGESQDVLGYHLGCIDGVYFFLENHMIPPRGSSGELKLIDGSWST